MHRRSRLTRLQAFCLSVIFALLVVHAPSSVIAQISQGATLTVLRGEVAIIHPDGTAVQPAPSGITVGAGDEIRTVNRAAALITFFSGTEIELGADTVLVVEQVSQDGDRVDIQLRQVLGATVNRVQTVAGSGSTYRIQAGGAVAVVRGTTFALVGPVTTSSGNVVTLACTNDCSSASSFAGCPLGPFSGYGVVTSGNQVASECVSFGVGRSEGLFDAAFQGVTTTEQHIQGDTHGVPAGQTASGQREQTGNRTEADRDAKPVDPVIVPGSPAGPGVQPCNTATFSGGVGTTTTVHQLGQTSGTFTFTYQAFTIPDRFQLIYEGNTLVDTGSVSGGGTVNVPFAGSTTTITVVVTGPTGTSWNYTLACPTPVT